MVQTSAGKKLSDARLAKGLSLDEAAHATKMRPDKLLALENDDYARFGSAAYAKGFLLMYSRFLGADVSDHLREFDAPEQRVNVADYQYLSNAPEPPPPPRMASRRLETRRPPSIIPLLLFVTLCVAGGFGYYVFVGMQRLGLDKPPAAPEAEVTPAAPASTAPVSKPVAETKSAPKPDGADEAKPAVEKPPAAAEPEGATPAVAAGGAKDAAALRAVADVEQGGNVNELVVEPLKKAWVKIRRDNPNSTPVFEGDLYPGVRPLKMRGQRFFVEVRDQTSVQIRKNGLPIAYQAPGISIQ